MNRVRQYLLGLIFIFILLSCSGGQLMRKSINIQPGYSKQQVLDLLNVPGNRQFKGKNEAWQYCETDAGFGYDDFLIVWFYDGKVTGISTYKNTEFGLCSAFFKRINWEDAPDKTIEIRQR